MLSHLNLRPLGVPDVVLVGSFLLLIIYVSNLIANHFKYRLNSIPGPFVNSVSVLPRLWSVAKGSSHLDDYEHHKKYGKIVRLSPTTVSVVDLGLFEAIYGISSKFHKAGFYEPVRFYDEEGLIPDPFVLSDKATHTRMKRNAANAYSLQALIQLEPLLDEVLDGLLTHLDKEYAGKGKLCDLGSYMLYFAVVWTLACSQAEPFYLLSAPMTRRHLRLVINRYRSSRLAI